MADMGSLVWIDVRVLDDDLTRLRRKSSSRLPRSEEARSRIKIDITCAGDFHLVDAVDLPGPCDQFLRDGAGRFFQLPGKLERDGVASSPNSTFGVWLRMISGGSIFHWVRMCRSKCSLSDAYEGRAT